MIGRRGLLRGAASLAVASAVWGCARAGEAGALSERQLKILALTSDLVIPRTDTPGAVDVGVPAFVALALKHGLDGTLESGTPGAPPDNDYGRWLETALDAAAGGDFLGTPAKQSAALTAIDVAAFASPAAPTPWKTLKGLILTGYYTSEAGGSKELRYQLVPGRWDPDIPAKPADRAWSSDWTAVEFS